MTLTLHIDDHILLISLFKLLLINDTKLKNGANGVIFTV